MKILIPDTLGSRISQKYRDLLPNLTIRGIDHPDIIGDNPHGAWCGWLAGAPLQALGGHHELVFLQMLSSAGTVENWADLICETIAAEKPDVVSCSWGAWDMDDRLREIFYTVGYDRYLKNLLKLKEELGFVLVGAAGNDDDNDEDVDTVFPQRMIPQHMWIVGATDVYGVPLPWSADGFVHTVMIGSKCMSPGNDGKWDLWQGTSAACPKFAGVVAAMGWNDAQITAALREYAEHPAELAANRPHTKWGWGSLEHAWQNLVAVLPQKLRPPRAINLLNTAFENRKDGKDKLP